MHLNDIVSNGSLLVIKLLILTSCLCNYSEDIASGKKSAFIALHLTNLQCCCNGGILLRFIEQGI